MLLAGLRKAGVPKIELKAVITPQNAEWTFYQLYQELEKEHESFQNKDKKLWNKNKEIGETFYGWFKHMKRVGGKRGYCAED